jgi:hypothetical protein
VNTLSPFDVLAGDSSKIRPSIGDCKSSFITLFGNKFGNKFDSKTGDPFLIIKYSFIFFSKYLYEILSIMQNVDYYNISIDDKLLLSILAKPFKLVEISVSN